MQSDTALPADTFENLRKKTRVKTYEHDTAHFLSALGLAWKACLEKTKIELELSTDIDMLEMIEKNEQKMYKK